MILIKFESILNDQTQGLHTPLETLYTVQRILLKEEVFNKIFLISQNSITIKINISAELLNMLDELRLNYVRVSLRRYNFYEKMDDGYLFQSSASICKTVKNLSNNNDTQIFKYSDDANYSTIVYSYENIGLTNRLIIKSLKLNSIGSQYFVMCIKLLNFEKNFEFFTDRMCFDCNFENENINFKYKPQFILLMYVLCGSIFFPVIICKHFIKKAKEKRLAIMNKKMKEMNRKNSQTREFLLPLLFKYEAQSIENFLTPVIDEARHILDDKPWKKSDSALSNSSFMPSFLNQSRIIEDFFVHSNLKRRSSLSNFKNFEDDNENKNEDTKSLGFNNEDVETIKSLSNSSESLVKHEVIRILLNDNIHSNGVILYESNV